MGIKGLNKLIADNAPSAIKNGEIKTFFGRKIAIDASMFLYQFLINVRQMDGSQLMNEEGETTSHLVGIFNRTVKIIENGIKPIYVFDGKPPTLKSGELAKRLARRDEAEKSLEKAQEAGAVQDINKFSRRLVKVSKEQNDEAKKLLKLMGIPYVNAPCEAEAQCAELARVGKVYATASEDMDTLTFACPVLLRHLSFSDQRKMPISEINLSKVLEGLDLDQKQFIDLCILLGCDYLEPIKGVGPVSALKLIREHKNLENIVKHFKEDNKSGKIQIPDDWEFQNARDLFLKPDVEDVSNLKVKWEQPDVDGLIEYLVKGKGFNEQRVRSAAEKLNKNLNSGSQGRLDSFFKVKPDTKKRKSDTMPSAKKKSKK